MVDAAGVRAGGESLSSRGPSPLEPIPTNLKQCFQEVTKVRAFLWCFGQDELLDVWVKWFPCSQQIEQATPPSSLHVKEILRPPSLEAVCCLMNDAMEKNLTEALI